MFDLIDIGGRGYDGHESGEGVDDDTMTATIMAAMMATKIKPCLLDRKILQLFIPCSSIFALL